MTSPFQAEPSFASMDSVNEKIAKYSLPPAPKYITKEGKEGIIFADKRQFPWGMIGKIFAAISPSPGSAQAKVRGNGGIPGFFVGVALLGFPFLHWPKRKRRARQGASDWIACFGKSGLQDSHGFFYIHLDRIFQGFHLGNFPYFPQIHFSAVQIEHGNIFPLVEGDFG